VTLKLMPTYSPLALDFSTADVEHPSLEYRNGDLVLRFTNWQDKPIVVRFSDVVAFRWQDDEKLPSNVRDDMAYEVIHSPWLAELRELGAAMSDSHHFKICFNVCGILDVVAAALV
jgi:hypothetical protein